MRQHGEAVGGQGEVCVGTRCGGQVKGRGWNSDCSAGETRRDGMSYHTQIEMLNANSTSRYQPSRSSSPRSSPSHPPSYTHPQPPSSTSHPTRAVNSSQSSAPTHQRSSSNRPPSNNSQTTHPISQPKTTSGSGAASSKPSTTPSQSTPDEI